MTTSPLRKGSPSAPTAATRALTLAAVLLGTAACATLDEPPADVGTRIVDDIEQARLAKAAERFEAVADREDYRERIYPVIYDAAQRHWAANELEVARPLLRFLVDRYPRAAAARQALLYVHLVQRGQLQGAPDQERLAEADQLLAELRSLVEQPPEWVSLVAAQQAIDRGQWQQARASLAEFEARWDGKPEVLVDYVVDLHRYLQSHATVAAGADGRGASRR